MDWSPFPVGYDILLNIKLAHSRDVWCISRRNCVTHLRTLEAVFTRRPMDTRSD